MKALIRENAYAWTDSSEMKKWLKDNEGKWVDIETAHLFTNQYNTDRYRIYDSMIGAIEDDARVGNGKCRYCGSAMSTGELCTKHVDCKTYGVEWFTPSNTYFLRYPSGIKSIEIKKQFQSIIKFGTYYFTDNFESLGYYVISNNLKTIKFKYDGIKFEVHNGIGYTTKLRLDIPSKALHELVNYFYKMKK